MQSSLNRGFALRYTTFYIALAGAAFFGLIFIALGQALWLFLVFLALVVVGIHDLRQTHHAILRNYPILGHMRFLLEYIRPEIRQYFIESETEAAPFSRAQRSLVYARAKGQSDKRPLGTQLDVQAVGYEWITHSMAPTEIASDDMRTVVGGKDCSQPYPISLYNISAMSFGALSANAILALNKGAKMGNFAHDTGEGSISKHHLVHGGDIIWEVASGYFGCRNEQGGFDPEKFAKNAQLPSVKMIEIKLSQGAKPGHGGVLPGPKVTPEIAEARGVPVGIDCVSPAAHSAFKTPMELIDFIVQLRQLSGGKPVGFKLCIGHPQEWFAIAKAMAERQVLPDFIVVDGSEGGTGAAPLEFSDHLGTPMREGLSLVHNTLVGLGLRDQIKVGASGKIVSAFDMACALALGADWCNSARGFMFAVGCIQAQTCHTGHCPTGVATQDPIRQMALVVSDKSERVKNFHHHTLEALRELLQAAGLNGPDDIKPSMIFKRLSLSEVSTLDKLYPSLPADALKGNVSIDELPEPFRSQWGQATSASFKRV
jgi:glutamate synthase domain-containing protein 2